MEAATQKPGGPKEDYQAPHLSQSQITGQMSLVHENWVMTHWNTSKTWDAAKFDPRNKFKSNEVTITIIWRHGEINHRENI